MTASRLPAPPEAAPQPDPNTDLEPLTLSWDSCVSRALVHRNAVAEVLLTDARALSDGHFLLAAQWPRSYAASLTSATSDSGIASTEHHDPMLAAETIRQVGLYICQKFLGAPGTSRPVIRNVGFRIDNSAEPVVGYGATDVLCRAEVLDVRHVDDVPYPVALSVRLQFSAAGREFGSAVGRVRVLSDKEYEMFRGPNAAAAPVPGTVQDRPSAAEVSVPSPGDVMLVRDPSGALLVAPADLRHPRFFDHPSDHVPGMVLLEAARQAACLAGASPGRLNGCHMHALRFTEWNSPVHVECAPAEDGWTFQITQDGEPTATGSLSFATKA
ncbi:ScbA/BarX family gamma-butyrolactone biosynthesis protein [Streptomyces sp. NBC_00696]|uniref:ScbA/BarX family gamma-butyrolactone biosynthesis protein n=1 Tax=Streptomyces sp. NBC_00696 TaxID=2903672 RepID=UPI002E2F5FD7|nr:ScbA/BarX family gamma-butyrolactone biosynthesis protein [Streptomyces sp. NBC_00696]